MPVALYLAATSSIPLMRNAAISALGVPAGINPVPASSYDTDKRVSPVMLFSATTRLTGSFLKRGSSVMRLAAGRAASSSALPSVAPCMYSCRVTVSERASEACESSGYSLITQCALSRSIHGTPHLPGRHPPFEFLKLPRIGLRSVLSPALHTSLAARAVAKMMKDYSEAPILTSGVSLVSVAATSNSTASAYDAASTAPNLRTRNAVDMLAACKPAPNATDSSESMCLCAASCIVS